MKKLICKTLGHKWKDVVGVSNLYCRDSFGNDISDKFVINQPQQCARCNLYKHPSFRYEASVKEPKIKLTFPVVK